MTIKIDIQEQYLDKFKDFINSLPNDAIKVDNITDNSISIKEAERKVKRALNNISSNQGMDFDSAFQKINNS